MAEDLSSVSMSVFLADPSGRILDRSVADAKLRGQLDSVMLAPGFRFSEDDVGTNALGLALLKSTPVIIRGEEHYMDALTAMVCAAAPIIDPATDVVLGAVDLTGPTGASDALMLALARQAAHSIGERLLDKATVADRALLEYFVRERRRARGPIAAINDRELITNAAAARMIGQDDHPALWQWASESLAAHSTGLRTLNLRASTYTPHAANRSFRAASSWAHSSALPGGTSPPPPRPPAKARGSRQPSVGRACGSRSSGSPSSLPRG